MSAVQAAAPSFHNAAVNMLVVMFIFAMLLCRPYWRTRAFYRAVVALAISSMLGSPLLHAHEVAAFSDRQQAAQAQQATDAARVQARDDAVAALNQPTATPTNIATPTSTPTDSSVTPINPTGEPPTVTPTTGVPATTPTILPSIDGTHRTYLPLVARSQQPDS